MIDWQKITKENTPQFDVNVLLFESKSGKVLCGSLYSISSRGLDWVIQGMNDFFSKREPLKFNPDYFALIDLPLNDTDRPTSGEQVEDNIKSS
jgi:hypothetical protein